MCLVMVVLENWLWKKDNDKMLKQSPPAWATAWATCFPPWSPEPQAPALLLVQHPLVVHLEAAGNSLSSYVPVTYVEDQGPCDPVPATAGGLG